MSGSISSATGQANQAAIVAAQQKLSVDSKASTVVTGANGAPQLSNQKEITQDLANLYGAQGTQDAYLGIKSNAKAETSRINSILQDANVDAGTISSIGTLVTGGLQSGQGLGDTNSATLGRQLGAQVAGLTDQATSVVPDADTLAGSLDNKADHASNT